MALPTPAPVEDPFEAALSFLSTKVDETGCVFEASCSARLTDWAIVALSATGRDPRAWPAGGTSPVAYLEADPNAHESGEEQREANWRARRILAILAAGGDPTTFGGVDHVAALRGTFAGQFGRAEEVNDDMFAVVALRAAGVPASDPMIAAALDGIESAQHTSGGWGFETATVAPTPDMTGAALMTLSFAGVPRSSQHVQRGLQFLLDNQANGGASPCATFGVENTAPNADSTAWVALGLTAYAIDVRRDPWAVEGASVMDCLLDHQHGDGGFGTYSKSSVYTTTQAVTALAGVPHGRAAHPLARPPAAVEVVGEARSDAPVTLRAAGAQRASWHVEGHGFLDGTTVTFEPTGPGEVDVELVTWNADGLANAATAVVQIAAPGEGGGGIEGGTDGNDRPTVGPPAVPGTILRRVNVTVSLEASDPDGQVVAFLINWGDGNHTGWVALDEQTHAYERLGRYEVRVYARDDDGAVSLPASSTLRVVNAPPVAGLDAPTTADRGAPVTFRDASVDPDGDVVGWAWDTGTGWRVGGPTLTHTFDAPGNHTVRLRASDVDGASDVASAEVYVRNAPPTIVAELPVAASAGQTLRLHANASDPEGDSVELRWGTPYGPGRGSRITLHLPDPGNVTITIVAEDAYGAVAALEHTIRVHAGGPDALDATVVRQSTDDGPAGDAGSEASADVSGFSSQARSPVLDLPARVEMSGDGGWFHGSAVPGTHAIARVEARMGGALFVEGTESFTVAVPPLAPGDYELAVRAVDVLGHAGPWQTATIVVPAPESGDETLSPTGAAGGEPPRSDVPAPGPTVLVLLVLAAAGWRRRR